MGTEQLQVWQSHKRVRAARVLEENVDSVSGRRTWVLEGGVVIKVGSDLMFRGGTNPVGGYYVEYKGGFQSWSPFAAFEEGYSRVEGGL